MVEQRVRAPAAPLQHHHKRSRPNHPHGHSGPASDEIRTRVGDGEFGSEVL